jgi:hypothetical protein
MSIGRSALVVALAVALLLGSLGVGLAQSGATTGDLNGTVRDESGALLGDAVVTATSPETGLSRSVATGSNGRFALAALPVGAYDVSVEHTGFAPRRLPRVIVMLGASADLELSLRLMGLEERVSVVADPSVEMERSPATTVISQDRIDELPTNGRNFIAFSLLAPGVSSDQTPQQGATRTSGLTFAGQRARSNNITVDGLDNNDETVGSVRALFSQEAVREFEVLATSFDAEFGKASGGVVNIVTKSGTNNFDGNVFGYFRHDALNAKGYFERFDPTGQSVAQPKAPFRQKQFGGIFGGPISRDRSFFFVSFERLDARASNFVTIDDRTLIRNPLNPDQVFGTPAQILRNAGFPVDTGNVPYRMAANQFLAKADLHPAPAHSVSIRVNAATELNENIEPFGGLVARSRAAALESTDVMVAMADTWVLSRRSLNELRAQVAPRNQLVRSLDPTCSSECRGETQGGPTLDVTGVASVGRQRFTPTFRDNVRYEIVDTASLFRGDHQFKAGIDASYIQGRRQSLPLYFGGRYIFQDASLPLVPGAPPVAVSAIQEVALGLPLAYVQGYGNSGSAYDTADVSLFGQDQWRLTSKISLNLGVRYQKQFWQPALYDPSGYPGTYGFPSDNKDVAPRIALRWTPSADRKTSVRAAYGLYYDNLISSIYGITRYVNGTDGVRTLVLRAPDAFSAWASPGHRLPEASALQILGGQYPSVAITADPALKTPYAHNVSVGVTRDLTAAMSVAVNGIYVRGFRQPGTIDYNPLVPALGPGRRPADVNGIAGTSASVLQYTSFGETWYRGLTVSLDRRLAGAAQFLISYTLSRSEDNSTDFQSAFLPQNNGRGRNAADPNGLPIGFNPKDERGPSVQDERHRFLASGMYLTPGDVQLSAILTVESGRPYNILAGADLDGDGDGGSPSPDRARRVVSDPATSVGRNSGRLPSQATLDLRILKRIRPRPGLTIDPMLEIFNVFNRTNFTDVQNVFGAGSYPANPVSTFGQYTQAGPPREAQLAIKVSF